uniref:Mitochondrial Rho GTPase n=1 Tax=Kalanchoe fedtschenkoi TaxID=63787 RepID=A0A7N0ZXL9_KALFE
MAGSRKMIRVVVVGDRGTGKSSLIKTAATEAFPDKIPPVLPPTRLPADFYPDRVPLTLVDTSASLDSRIKLLEELKRADVVVLTYACDQPATLERAMNYWMQEIRQLELKVPVIVVGCKLDLRAERDQVSLETVMLPVMQKYREIETCIECSAATQIQVPDVFFYAQKAVLHPTAPIFDQETQSLKPRCIRALKRIFSLCDIDGDGALNDSELNEFQAKCFDAPLKPDELVAIKEVVQDKLPEGINERGLTQLGFMFLQSIFIERGRLETTWAVLRKFGYDNEIKLRDDLIPVPKRRTIDQNVELTDEVVEFLKGIFRVLDQNVDGSIGEEQIAQLFSTAPDNPWDEFPFKDATERTSSDELPLNGFLCKWALMTHLKPALSSANLIYIGLGDQSASAFRVTKSRSSDRKKKQSNRSVFRCLVFGPQNAGKSALLDSFIKRPFSMKAATTNCERYAVNIVENSLGVKKTLILQEIPEERAQNISSRTELLAACDVAIFMYDSSKELSWKKTTELLLEVARTAEETGHCFPCLLVAAKEDLGTYPTAVHDIAKICRNLGIKPPISVSAKNESLDNIFSRIVTAAEHPHLSIPETEIGRGRREYQRLVNRSLMLVSVGAAVAFIGMAAYRTYSARKNTSA